MVSDADRGMPTIGSMDFVGNKAVPSFLLYLGAQERPLFDSNIKVETSLLFLGVLISVKGLYNTCIINSLVFTLTIA